MCESGGTLGRGTVARCYEFTNSQIYEGGFGPTLHRAWSKIWTYRMAAAAATAGQPTGSIASHERRCLERTVISAEKGTITRFS